MRLRGNIITAVFIFLLNAASYAQDRNALPGIEKGRLIYQNDLSSRDEVKNWTMEGPGMLAFRNGWMEMYSPGKKWDHVFWCEKVFPARFIAEWEVQNLRPEEGLLLVFFAATGSRGESIFDPALPARDGTFKYYNRGKLHCYHISYYANNPKHPDRGDSHLRKDPMFALLQTGAEGIPAASLSSYHIRLIKDDGRIAMYVNERKIIDYTDDGTKYGPVYGAGNIGFRQMRWSRSRYRGFKVWEIKKQD